MRASTASALLALLAGWAPAAAVVYTPIPNPIDVSTGATRCSLTQYLDISAMQCAECPAGQVPSASGCRCKGGVLTADFAGVYTCVPCGSGKAAMADGTGCLACGNTTLGIDATLGECVCAAGKALLETNGHGALLSVKECAGCGATAYASSSTGECVPCPAPYQTVSSAGCVCQSGFVEKQHPGGLWASGLGGGDVSCVAEAAYTSVKQFDASSANIVAFGSLVGGGSSVSVNSKAFEQLLVAASTECLQAVTASSSASDKAPRVQPRELGNAACNAVANLCVAQLYERNTAACAAFDLMMSRSTVKAYASPSSLQWWKRLPWLYYDTAQVATLLSEVPLQVALSGTQSVLKYVVAAYAINGTFLGMQPFAEQLQLCTGVAADPSAFLRVGTALKVSCSLDVGRLLAFFPEPVFYDLYLTVAEGSLYPVPVKLLNIAENADAASSNDKLVRRFFAADTLSGRASGSGQPQAVRYVSQATLTVTLEPNLPTRILAPLLTLEYAQARLGTGADGAVAVSPTDAALETTFRAEYTMDLAETTYSITICFILSIVAWVVGWLFLLFMQMRRNKGQVGGRLPAASAHTPPSARLRPHPSVRIPPSPPAATPSPTPRRPACTHTTPRSGGARTRVHTTPPRSQVVDTTYLVGALARLCRVFADIFFVFLFGCAGWMLIIYKEQKEIYVMMPLSEGPNESELSRVFRAVLVAVFVAKWVHIVELVLSQTRHGLFFIDWEQPKGAADAEHAEGEVGLRSAGEVASGVSTWRTIFVANEWAQLQGVRTVSLELSLVSLLFLQQGLGLEDFSRLTPFGTGGPGVPHDLFLRFALSSFLLIALALVQWLVRWVLWNRFVQDRVWQFVDLLAVTNVSCLLLEEQTYGYYLHGRSVHDHADTDMLQISRNLKREEEGLCTKRGLLKDSDVQSFEIFVSKEVRERYDKAIRGAGQLSAARAGQSARRRGFNATPEDMLIRQRETNAFLTSFISGNLERETLKVRPKQYWERLINLPPEMNGSARESIFLEDPAGSFKRLLLAGREHDVVLFHVIVFGFFDMRFANTFVAIFATYVADLIVRFARHHLAVRNIARKTLLDPRFLL